MKLPIYMDNNATTPVDPRVVEEMIPYFTEMFGNASSNSHKFGWEASAGVETARKRVADFIGAIPKEIVFTSGATESDNLAIKGAAEIYRSSGNHIITSQIEHKAVLDTCEYLQRHGFEITYLPVDESGLIDLDQLNDEIRDSTILVSIMMANNEIGTIEPVKEIGEICKEKNVIFHCDATQAMGKVNVNVKDLNIDLMSMTAHKMYGPKGSGALYMNCENSKLYICEQMHGGGHEKKRRSGTLNVPGIVGFGKACELAGREIPDESVKHIKWRDKIINELLNAGDIFINGHLQYRLPNNANMSIGGINGEVLLGSMKDIAVSSGSACSSDSMNYSHVLKAIGRNPELARATLRFGLGRFTTEEEVDYTIEKTIETVRKLRKRSSLQAI
jgi:cysteine desulfurase